MKTSVVTTWIPVIYLYGVLHTTAAGKGKYGECENATVTYEVDLNYDVINVARTIASSGFRCWTLDLQAAKVEEPDMVLQLNIISRPSGRDPGAGRTDRCYDGGSMDVTDGMTGTLLFVICSDTGLEYSDQIFSYGRNLTIRVTSEANPEVIEFDIWATKKDDVPSGYYDQFVDQTGGVSRGVYIGLGISGAIFLVIVCQRQRRVAIRSGGNQTRTTPAASQPRHPGSTRAGSANGQSTSTDLSSDPPSYDTVAGQQPTQPTTVTTQTSPQNPALPPTSQTAPPPNPPQPRAPSTAATTQPPPQNLPLPPTPQTAGTTLPAPQNSPLPPSPQASATIQPPPQNSAITRTAIVTQRTENDTNLENGVFRLTFEVTGTFQSPHSGSRAVGQSWAGPHGSQHPQTLSASALLQGEEHQFRTSSSTGPFIGSSRDPPSYNFRPENRPDHPVPHGESGGDAPPTYESIYPRGDPQQPTSDC